MQNKTGIIIGIIVFVGALIAGAWWFKEKEDNRAPQRQDVEDNEGSREEDGLVVYKDGSYTQTGEYRSPAGRETISINLDIQDGVVVAADFTGDATNPTSVMMQGRFSQGFEQAVVGRSIHDLSLSVVNGSSLTPRGFNDALQKIKDDARTIETHEEAEEVL